MDRTIISFDMNHIDYIRLRILCGVHDPADLYIFIPYDGTTFLYRFECDEKKSTMLDEQELFGTGEEILEQARKKARKFAEKNYDCAEVLLVEDATEEPFPGTLEDKLITAIIMYGCMKNIMADTNQPNQTDSNI